MASLLPVHIDQEEIQRQSFYLSQTRYVLNNSSHRKNVGNKYDKDKFPKEEQLADSTKAVSSLGGKIKCCTEFLNDYVILLCFRVDSDVEEKYQNAIEQVWCNSSPVCAV